MFVLKSGELRIRNGTFSVSELQIEEGATLCNEAEVRTHTTVSAGEIRGHGTLWAHVSSKFIGGVIDRYQIVIYWPREWRMVLPMPFGKLFSIPKRKGDGELT